MGPRRSECILSETTKPFTRLAGQVTYKPTTPTGTPWADAISHSGVARTIVAFTGTPRPSTKSAMPCFSAVFPVAMVVQIDGEMSGSTDCSGP